jgi:hypothetical protein
MARLKKTEKLEIDLETCASCRFFLLDDPKEIAGYCRHNPPVSVVDEDGGGWTFPVVVYGEWCGQYSRKLQG